MKYYVDTCVWIDFFMDRHEIDIFIDCLYSKDIILYSYPLERELLDYLSLDSIRFSLNILKDILVKIEVNSLEKEEAYLLSMNRSVPFNDALHAIIARDNGATLVTRDKHFLRLDDICPIILL